LLDGLRPDRIAHFRAVPALAEHIDEAPDPDRWAAAHHTALGLEIPPFESVFVSESGHMDDGTTIRQAHAQGGFGGARSDVPPDHAGTGLSYLSWLSAVEADAVEDGQEAATTHVQGLTRSFIDAHLGRWLPALSVGASTSPGIHPFFTGVISLATELVADHRLSLLPEATPWALPTNPDPLADPKTRLADLARYLTTPSRAGGMLSRGALASVGRATAVPKGFGSRTLMLTNLMSSAAELGQLSDVLQGLGAVVGRWVNAHEELGSTVWADRARQTASLLQRMDALSAQIRE
jgi:hypothetical protein